MTELSPAAQAVWNAYQKAECDPYLVDPRRVELAAALRAAADQVVPDQGTWIRECRGDAWTRYKERKLIRREILAIAHELEAQ